MKKIAILALVVLITFGCMDRAKNNTGEIAVADSTQLQLGEGAIWDHESSRLFYIDIIGKKLFEFHPASGKKREHSMPSMIGTVVVKDNDEVLVALVDGIYTYNLETKKLDLLICPTENDSTQRFNDGKCDPAGRFWVGTMSLVGGKETSHLFCLDNNGSIEAKFDGITISNGIVWSSDKKFMYYIDTPTRKVMEYSYDNETGEISNPRVAVSVPDTLGAPDGMAIDSENRLWVCMWGGSAVCCFNPETGALVERIEVPAKNVTSCAFAGENLDEMYITTARVGTSESQLKRFPQAGATFKVTLKGAGSESNRYVVNYKMN